MANYRKHSREQIELKMMCINDFVPEDHEARIIVSIIETLNLTPFDEYYNNDSGGNTAYPITNMLNIISYAFLNGVRSPRKIEKNCHENIVYRYLCCDDPPDHSTISRFWTRFKDDIERLLVQTVYIGEQENLIDYEHVSGDGVKIKSMGSRRMLFNEKSGRKRLENIEKRISRLKEEIDNDMTQDEKKNFEKKIERQKDLKIRITKGLDELKALQSKIKEEKKDGQKRENVNYRHVTEEEARLMKKNDRYISGYNAQAMVDNKNNMILTSDVSDNCADAYLGEPMLEKMKEAVGEENFQKGDKTLDNGYFDADFLKYAEKNDIKLYVDTSSVKKLYNDAPQKPKKNALDLEYDEKKDVYYCKAGKKLERKRVSYNGNDAFIIYEKYGCSKECKYFSNCVTDKKKKRKQKSIRCLSLDKDISKKEERRELEKRMVDKMETDEAKEIYKKRLSNVEPVFAHIEEHRGFRRFSVWGLAKAKGQWAFSCFVHNLNKIMRYSNYGRKVLKFQRVG